MAGCWVRPSAFVLSCRPSCFCLPFLSTGCSTTEALRTGLPLKSFTTTKFTAAVLPVAKHNPQSSRKSALRDADRAMVRMGDYEDFTIAKSANRSAAGPSQQAGGIMADPKERIEQLKSLIQLCRDGHAGFKEAAEKLTDPATRSFFQEQSLERARFAGELESELHRLGEKDV